jgi:hypothetical protein
MNNQPICYEFSGTIAGCLALSAKIELPLFTAILNNKL